MRSIILNYGYKHVIHLILGAVIAAAWLLTTTLFMTQASALEAATQRLGIYIIIAFTIYEIHSLVSPGLRSPVWISIEQTVISLILAYSIIPIFDCVVTSIEFLRNYSYATKWNLLAGVLFSKIGITYVILMISTRSFGLIEQLKESRFFRQFTREQGGSAKWAGPEVYRKRRMRWVTKGLSRPFGKFSHMIFLGRNLVRFDPQAKDIGIDNDAHMLTIGVQGSGKSTTTIYPNLAYYNGSALVIDPKGEHARTTMARRSGTLEGGLNFPSESKSYMLDPFELNNDLAPSNYYNPLTEIDVNNPGRATQIISAITDALVEPEVGKNKHFSDTSRLILKGVTAQVVSVYPDPEKSLGKVFDLINGIDPETGFADYKNVDELVIQMAMNPALGGLPQQAARLLDSMGPSEKGGMITTIGRSISWISDPQMRKHLSKSDFSFQSFGVSNKIETVYVVIPLGKINAHKRWLRMITSVSIACMRDRKQKVEGTPTLFVLDEFPQMGNLEVIQSGFATLRSEKIKLWPFVQNLGQLKANFGDEWATFIANSNTQVFGVGMGDIETAEWLSRSLGNTVDANGQKKALLSEAEIMNSIDKNSNLQIVLPCDAPDGTENLPMLMERLTYKPVLKGFGHTASKRHFSDW